MSSWKRKKTATDHRISQVHTMYIYIYILYNLYIHISIYDISRCNLDIESLLHSRRRAQAGLRVYALDLLGNGYTDKLDPVSQDTI